MKRKVWCVDITYYVNQEPMVFVYRQNEIAHCYHPSKPSIDRIRRLFESEKYEITTFFNDWFCAISIYRFMDGQDES